MENYDISLFLLALKKASERLIAYKKLMYSGKSNNKWLNEKIILELRLIIKNCERLINTIKYNDGM